ncbi:unnamed protein product [Rotaria socialis]
MVKTYIGQWLYTFPWSQVISGFWQKYPNPYSGHILSEDVYYRTVTGDQTLITKRLLTKTSKIPRWGERIFSRGSASTIAFIIEESICDLKQKTFTTISKNINLTSLMTVDETCIYRPDQNDESRTICEKKVLATSILFGFKTTLETFAIKRYKKNQELASLGLEFTLHKLFLPHLPLPPVIGIKKLDTRSFSNKMPELPEVEYARKLLSRFLNHTHITKVSYPDADSLARRFMNCTPTTFANSLVNRKIIDIKRHGKYLWFEMADQQPLTPIFHFGMSGGFRIKSAPDVTYAKEIKLVKMKAKNEVDGQCESFVYDEQLDADLSWPPRFTRIRFTTATGHDVCYTDLRKFGRFHLVDSITPLSCLPLSKLGFDPYLDMPKLEKFIDLAQSYRPASIELKALLLDQSFCAGIGNWIADEILYQSSFHPRKRLNTLNDEQFKLLHKNIDYVIRTAVDAGSNERFPREWLFHYRWTNKRETEDYYKLAIKFDTVGGRTSAYVPQRQKLSNVEQQQVEVKLAAKELERKSKEKTEEEDGVDEENKKIINSADIKVSKKKISIKKMIATDSEVNEPLVKRKVPIAPSIISNRPQRTCNQKTINYQD